MCKTIKKTYDKKLTFENLMIAFDNAFRNKRRTKENLYFEMKKEVYVYNIYKKLKNGTYKPGRYRQFLVYEPKERVIMSLPFEDRIVHQWVVEEFLKPFFIPRFISHTFACIPGRGTHSAFEKLREFNDKMYYKYHDFYIVKCDIKKFFYSIDQEVLYNILKKKISDKKLLNLLHTIIFDNHTENNTGIPIGNYTSQYFANIYLGELDYYVKYELKVKYYIRYMDDFIMMFPTKDEARKYFNIVEGFVNEKLHLKFNHKSRIFPSYKGIDFCGYVIKKNKNFIRKSFVIRYKRRCKKWNKLYRQGKLDLQKLYESVNSYNAHIAKCDTDVDLTKWLDKDIGLKRIDIMTNEEKQKLRLSLEENYNVN